MTEEEEVMTGGNKDWSDTLQVKEHFTGDRSWKKQSDFPTEPLEGLRTC